MGLNFHHFTRIRSGRVRYSDQPLALRSREALAQGSCVTLENQLKGLEAGQARLQKDLQREAGEDKESLVQQIKELESGIRQKQAELIKDKCKGVGLSSSGTTTS